MVLLNELEACWLQLVKSAKCKTRSRLIITIKTKGNDQWDIALKTNPFMLFSEDKHTQINKLNVVPINQAN